MTQVVIVTGASSGIGRAVATAYARRGASLALSGRSHAALQSVTEECRAAGAAGVCAHGGDVAEPDHVEHLFEVVREVFGDVDVAVHCAGVAAFGRFEAIAESDFNRVIEVNVLGAANLARVALGKFRCQGSGHLVITGSVLGHCAVPFMAPYVASKFALTGLTRALQQETGDAPGVHVHGCFPNSVDTPIFARSANYMGRRAHAQFFAVPAEVTAAAILRTVDRDNRDVWDTLTARGMLLGYRLLPRVYDALVGPLMRRLTFADEPVEPGPGDVHETRRPVITE